MQADLDLEETGEGEKHQEAEWYMNENYELKIKQQANLIRNQENTN